MDYIKKPHRTGWLWEVIIPLVFYPKAAVNWRPLILECEDLIKMINDLYYSP